MDLEKASGYHLAALRANQSAQSTLNAYSLHERRFVGFVSDGLGEPAPLAALSVAAVRRFADWLASSYATTDITGGPRRAGAETVRQNIEILKIWSKFLWREGLFPGGDPLEALRPPRKVEKVVEAFSRGQVELLVSLCATTRKPLRNAAILLLLADTGLRVSELCGLGLQDVDLAGHQRPGRAKVLGKGARERYVYFGGKTSQALIKYLSTERAPVPTGSARRALGFRPTVGVGHQSALFLSQGRPIRRTAVLELVKDLGTRAGITGMRVSPHVLRHTWATEYLKAHPGQISQVQALLGHSTLEMTQRYARLAERDLEGGYESLLDGWNLRLRPSAATPRPREVADTWGPKAASLVELPAGRVRRGA